MNLDGHWRRASRCDTGTCVEVRKVNIMALGSDWRRASRCESGSCVEVRKVDDMILDEQWRKATKSNNNGACAELRASADGGVEVRDSKNPGGPTLTFTAKEWDAFLDGAKNGEFEIA
jgi:Domain of unknown function (DUF397)